MCTAVPNKIFRISHKKSCHHSENNMKLIQLLVIFHICKHLDSVNFNFFMLMKIIAYIYINDIYKSYLSILIFQEPAVKDVHIVAICRKKLYTCTTSSKIICDFENYAQKFLYLESIRRKWNFNEKQFCMHLVLCLYF